MKTFIAIALAFSLANSAQAQHLGTGTKIQCTSDNIFFIKVEVLKVLKPDMILNGKFKVKVTEHGPRLDESNKVAYSVLHSSSISTRTVAGVYYQTVIFGGKVLALEDIHYSIFEDQPVGFKGKIHNLKHGYETPVTCEYL